MLQISLREANQHFSQYVEAVQSGDEVIITRRGKPVARMLSITKEKRTLNAAQKTVWHALLKEMRKGYHLGGEKFKREDAHER